MTSISAILGVSLDLNAGAIESLISLNAAAITMIVSASLLGVLSASLYRRKREQALRIWSAGWFLLALYVLLHGVAGYAVTPRRMSFLSELFLGAAVLAFYWAARHHAHRAINRGLLGAGAAIAAIWAVAYSLGWFPIPLNAGAGLVLVLTAQTFWLEGRKQDSRVEAWLAGTFLLCGFLEAMIALAGRTPDAHIQGLWLVALAPMIFAGVLMVMAVYEEDRRRVERNMLGLANDLAASSVAGSEIEKVLSQVLERVIHVARVPFGALCVHYGEGSHFKLVLTAGLPEAFAPAIRENHLDRYTSALAARSGGLIRIANLRDDSEHASLEAEAEFRNLRRLLQEQRFKSAIIVCLQAKEKAFGALLIGAPDKRRFSPSDLNFLSGLGQQIGSAIESSYLVRQTSRRSGELHVLNEIGRALSSTLDLDSLLERIYVEMRRLVDVSSFLIASCDSKMEEIRFEIEVTDGKRLPKRTRPAGNHLVEYVIRTGQPLLIRDHYMEETQRRGFQPLRQVGSLCAVPLILYDRPVGVMMVHSPKERVFDEGHTELLRILASEASIAIENARLFSEEQKKSRHLTLINNVSNHAITTLNPVEMLEKIAREIASSLAYDHIGIATLDYATKELVIQAEAGARKDARGRRIGLGEGMVGQVARSGQVAMVREASASMPKMVLSDSVSSMALPVIYAEQLLGVLYVESATPCDFPQQEILLLRTLADLFAGALHNALTFQKAQEQAITDGLTGVKTHRFLMEALSAEWKRSTRANRPFALVLMDLDRFKFVNDFYGHLEGDAILQRVGHILEQNCRRSDVVARYGGDEFVILMPETSIEQASQLANKLRSWVAADPLLRDKNVTASFGIAGFPMHGATPQELIQVADSSMYLSKHQGGNSVSTAEQGDPNDRKKWKKDVLEAYLGVTLKRLFATGPQAFEEIYRRLELFTRSLVDQGTGSADQTLPPAVVETVTSLAFAIDAKDQYTQGHSQKVSAYAVVLAQALGLDQSEVEEIRLAGLLHDIGKVGIPEAILNKSGPLDAAEWETMKTHTELGAKILEPLETMARIRQMVRHHHEFYDGSGYPDRLKGEAIPYGSRVIAIADSYDTITSARSYKKGRSPEEAFAELERCAATQFDPAIVRVFVEKMRRFPDAKSRLKEFTVHSAR
jgi:diguanylate cyclase (GGDEF)-like protein/putative nucleotidyltransferase with HDIG domain